MNLTKLLGCVAALLRLTQALRTLKKCVTVLTLLVLCCGTAALLLQKKASKKVLRKVVRRVIG